MTTTNSDHDPASRRVNRGVDESTEAHIRTYPSVVDDEIRRRPPVVTDDDDTEGHRKAPAPAQN